MKTRDFTFRVSKKLRPDLPSELRGERRDHARLVVLHRRDRRVEHARFDGLGAYLRPGDVLVVNDSLVLHDELSGRAAGGEVTLVLCGHHREGWHALVEPASRAKRGAVVEFGDGELRAILVEPTQSEMWLVRFEPLERLAALLERHGQRYGDIYEPLREHPESWQNVYARKPGSLETPTAGLHFTRELLGRIESEGVEIVPITLHVGLSELEHYWKIETDEVETHRMSAEWYQVTRAAAAAINRARRTGGRVVAVGTTVVRTLETLAQSAGPRGALKAGSGWTDLYIHPGHRFRVVDLMLTNLHRPRSSHLVLVAAFAGREFTLEAYREIVERGYRFDVFGDSMLLI